MLPNSWQLKKFQGKIRERKPTSLPGNDPAQQTTSCVTSQSARGQTLTATNDNQQWRNNQPSTSNNRWHNNNGNNSNNHWRKNNPNDNNNNTSSRAQERGLRYSGQQHGPQSDSRNQQLRTGEKR
ncbi:hypothetical protein TcasGA2_TC031296 [Tribolium castaneum]|uniref:Uncharacterized protein n=1 Tax=Tribolium castaneum TaxID=7070 RepID=A0A139W9X3_TRICA|nr:hypothetical protein TcasGA2_TC031296 [Tribolium castaneum]